MTDEDVSREDPDAAETEPLEGDGEPGPVVDVPPSAAPDESIPG